MKTTKKFGSGGKHRAEAAGCPEEKPLAALTIWATTRQGGRIICRPHVVAGPFQIVTSGRELPPEWLERLIPIADDQEDASWR
ncbi:MAG: hypothetical protein ACREIA_24705 [Opitutaceae bacterium]